MLSEHKSGRRSVNSQGNERSSPDSRNSRKSFDGHERGSPDSRNSRKSFDGHATPDTQRNEGKSFDSLRNEKKSVEGFSSALDGKRSQNFEILTARTELKKKINDVNMLKKSGDIARVQLKTIEGNYDVLKNSMDVKEKMANKKQRIMAKLNITNQMLIQTLNTLELNTEMIDGFITTQKKAEGGELFMSMNNDTYLQNLKLKESLLNLTRDHYRAADGIRHMGTGIEELRLSLQEAGKKNRQLLIELAVLRNEDVQDMVKTMKKDATASGTNNNPDADEHAGTKSKDYGDFDKKFQVLLESQVIDPLEGIMQLRRFVYHFAAVPKLLSTKSVAAHIMNKDLLEIFEVGMICLFLHVPAKPGFVHKYTPRSPFPELIDMKTSNSLAKEIMKFGM
jgi:hypothetical protein